MKLRVKICGNTTLADAECAVRAGADAVGFIFHPPSPRCMQASAVAEIASALPGAVERVGIFVDRSAKDVSAIARAARLTAVQLAGSETPLLCRDLAKEFAVWKVFHVGEGFDATLLDEYEVAAFLFDTPSPLRGGSGKTFEWNLLRGVREHLGGRVPFYLAGGLAPDNVAAAIAEVQPDGVDVCSGVESAPGTKDHDKVRKFLLAARAAGKRFE